MRGAAAIASPPIAGATVSAVPSERDRERDELGGREAFVQEHRREERDERRVQVEQQRGEPCRRELERGEIGDRLAAVAQRAERDQHAERRPAREPEACGNAAAPSSPRTPSRSAAPAASPCRRRTRRRIAPGWPSRRTRRRRRPRTPLRRCAVGRRHRRTCRSRGSGFSPARCAAAASAVDARIRQAGHAARSWAGTPCRRRRASRRTVRR